MRNLRLGSALLISALSLSAAAAVRADTSPLRETICAVSASPAQDLMPIDRASLVPGPAGSACVHARKSPASHSIKVAVGFCVDRCYQQFDYCHYRHEPYEHCLRRLAGKLLMAIRSHAADRRASARRRRARRAQ